MLSIFGVAKQELHGPQVAGSTIDERCLCSPQRMSAKEIRIEPDAGDPFRKEPCILPHGHAPGEGYNANVAGVRYRLDLIGHIAR